MSCPCTELLLFNYAKINSISNSLAPLCICSTNRSIFKLYDSFICSSFELLKGNIHISSISAVVHFVATQQSKMTDA